MTYSTRHERNRRDLEAGGTWSSPAPVVKSVTTGDARHTLLMANDPVRQVVLSMPCTHIGGQWFVKRGCLGIYGGFDRAEAWTPNYDAKTCAPESLNRRIVHLIKNTPEMEVCDFPADETRVIGGAAVCDPCSGLVFSFGGLKQVAHRGVRLLEKCCSGKLLAFDIDQSCESAELFNAMKEFSDMTPLQESWLAYRPSVSAMPCPRMFHATAWDPCNGRLWVFGGLALNEQQKQAKFDALDDLWIWSSNTGLWRHVRLEVMPPAKIGASMVFMDGQMYLFGGMPVADQEYLWSVNADIGEGTKWEKTPLPPELRQRVNGCVLVPFTDSLNRRYLFFSGGMMHELYGKLFRGVLETRICANVKYCSIWRFSLEKKLCEACWVSDSLPEVAYHCAARIGNHLMFTEGVNYHEKQNSCDLSVNSTAIRVHVNALLDKKKVSVSKTLAVTRQDRVLDNTITRAIKGATWRCITKALAHPRNKKLHGLFQNHQKTHSAKHFVLLGDTYIEKTVLDKRFGLSGFPFFIKDRVLIRDIVMYAYTDCVDPCIERHLSFVDFLAVMEYCRARGLYRFMSLELGLVIGGLTATSFFTIALSCTGFPGIPMFADPHLPMLKTAFEKLLPQYHSFADFTSMDGCPARLSRYVLSHLHVSPADLVIGSSDDLEAMIPGSNYETVLTEYFASDLGITTTNGPLFVDGDFLSFDPDIVAHTDLYVVRAVYECNLEPIFAFNSIDLVVSVIKLINSSKTHLDEDVIVRLLGACESMFIDFAKKSDMISPKLLALLPTVRFRRLSELVVDMLGIRGEVVIRGANGCSVMYDATIGTNLPIGEINTNVTRSALMALVVLMYGQCTINSLPEFFDRDDLADQFLTLCDTSSFLPPQTLRKVIIEFVIGRMFNKETITPDSVAKHFPRLFRADIHTRVVALCNVWDVARCAEQYMFAYDTEQIKWLLAQTCPTKPS